ncbi:LamB/YcsF family protein, partial [Klebsiella pneumoniae]|nr:LamB/YcsF family protein [Klebsiella pneumoniae]
HAAMGNMINRDDALALQVMQAVARIDSQLIIFCQPDTIIERAAQAAGLPVLTLFLADRAYDDRGQLVPRGIAGSLIKEEA